MTCPNRIWLNDGTGRFTDSGQVLDEGTRHIHDIALGDVDGDGDADLVVGMTEAPWARIYRNDGRGCFIKSGTFGSSWIDCLAPGDLDGDGATDFFIGGGFSNKPSEVWINDGRGNFRNGGTQLSVASNAALGDFNRDGRLDIFAVSIDQQSKIPRGRPVKVYLNTTHGK